MAATVNTSRWKFAGMALAFCLYLTGRICQLWADRLPALLIVLLHVFPPAIFAVIHGSVLYGRKGMLVFGICCLGVGGFFESLSLRTGFPFGHYYFTDVMGPKVFGLPILLVLAYLGIGYCCWVLAMLILGYRDRTVSAERVVALPVLAACLMLAWDLAMEPDWATLDRAWIWRQGGPFFGVPVSNFLGWYLTGFVFYLLFALYCRANPASTAPLQRLFWSAPIAFYALCAMGNLLILKLPMAPPVVADARGRQWTTSDILGTCATISLVVMLPMSLLAWLRLNEAERAIKDRSSANV